MTAHVAPWSERPDICETDPEQKACWLQVKLKNIYDPAMPRAGKRTDKRSTYWWSLES